jgi:hypothetical protein
MKVNEGLLEHDLDFTIMPLISVDEYESKIDDRKAIVVGFYITDKDPATDLASFIEKGTVHVLDVDVSPAPTDDGHYMVFVEIDRNKKFPERLLRIINDLGRVTNVKEWEFSPLHSKQDENYPLTLEELEKRTNLDPEKVEIEGDETAPENVPSEHVELSERISIFLRNALVESFNIDSDIVMINNHSYKIVEFNHTQPELPIIITEIGDSRLTESNTLQNMLGQSYAVYVSGNDMLVTNDSGYLLLQPID